MQSILHRLKFYRLYARDTDNLEYCLRFEEINGPYLFVPKKVGLDRLKEELARQVPEPEIQYLSLDVIESDPAPEKIVMDEHGLFISQDKTRGYTVQLSKRAFLEGLFSPVPNTGLSKATSSNLSRQADRTGNISKRVEVPFWNMMRNLNPDCKINYIALMGQYTDLEPEFIYINFAASVKGLLENWPREVKELYPEFTPDFSYTSSLDHPPTVLSRNLQDRNEHMLFQDVVYFGKVVKLFGKSIDLYELWDLADELRSVRLPSRGGQDVAFMGQLDEIRRRMSSQGLV